MAEDASDPPVSDDPADEIHNPGEELVAQLPDREKVPTYVRRMFWSAVLMANAALLAVSLGILVFVLIPAWRMEALGLVGIGLICAAGTYLRYRQFKRRHSQSA